MFSLAAGHHCHANLGYHISCWPAHLDRPIANQDHLLPHR